ncbi:MAG: hypothetical protein Tsb0027_23130 [Wenzhouxiangellaceae bacterium]
MDGLSNPAARQDENRYNLYCLHAPVAQLDRVLPSEGRGRRFDRSLWNRSGQRHTLAPQGRNPWMG